jgi:hypothetical protein
MIRKKNNGSANRNRKKESGNTRGTLRSEVSVSGTKTGELGKQSHDHGGSDTRNPRRRIRSKGQKKQPANKLGDRNHRHTGRHHRLSTKDLCDQLVIDQAFTKLRQFLLKDQEWLRKNSIRRFQDGYELFSKYILKRSDQGWQVLKTGIDQGYFFRGTSAWAWCLADRRPGSDSTTQIRELDRQLGFVESDIENTLSVLSRTKDAWRKELLSARYSDLQARRIHYAKWLEKYLNRTKYLELRTLK